MKLFFFFLLCFNYSFSFRNRKKSTAARRSFASAKFDIDYSADICANTEEGTLLDYKKVSLLYNQEVGIKLKLPSSAENPNVYLKTDQLGCKINKDFIGFCGYVFISYERSNPIEFRVLFKQTYHCIQLKSDPFIYLGFDALKTNSYPSQDGSKILYFPKLVRLPKNDDCAHPDFEARLFIDNYINDCLNIATLTFPKRYVEVFKLPLELEQANNSLIVREYLGDKFNFLFDSYSIVYNDRNYYLLDLNRLNPLMAGQFIYMLIETNSYYDVAKQEIKPFKTFLKVSEPIGTKGRFLMTETSFKDYEDAIDKTEEMLKILPIKPENLLKGRYTFESTDLIVFELFWSGDGMPIIVDSAPSHSVSNCDVLNKVKIKKCAGSTNNMLELYTLCPNTVTLYVENTWLFLVAKGKTFGSAGSDLCFLVWVSNPIDL